ncbi:MAG: hypothetical protein HY248_05225, partial [Fimbriimonas ginsengisoli]|nr:hypothetical protein [Fimbriimonas ginsengisoli]
MLVAAALLSGQGTVQLSGGLVIGGMAKGGRTPVTVDFVQDLLCQGTWLTPTLGGKLAGPDAEQHAWEAAKPNADGWVESPLLEIGGYYWATYDSPAREVMLLSAEGDTMAYVNGTPRAGDPYGWGSLHLPFVARQGVNTFLFSCSRGHVRAKIERPRKPVAIDATDATLPDALDGDRELWGAIVVVNATEKRVVGA